MASVANKAGGCPRIVSNSPSSCRLVNLQMSAVYGMSKFIDAVLQADLAEKTVYRIAKTLEAEMNYWTPDEHRDAESLTAERIALILKQEVGYDLLEQTGGMIEPAQSIARVIEASLRIANLLDDSEYFERGLVGGFGGFCRKNLRVESIRVDYSIFRRKCLA